MSEGLTLANLSLLPRWVTWRNEYRGNPPTMTKVPYSPDRPRSKASANDPATWSTRDKAMAAMPTVINGLGGGVGLELGDLGNGSAVGGIDVDTCRSADGRLEPWAVNVIERFGSYTEISPSTTGVKLLFLYDTSATEILQAAMGGHLGRSWKRGGGGVHPPGIELYLSNRYFAVTDDALPNFPTNIMPAPTELLLELIRSIGPGFKTASPPKMGTDKGRSEAAFAKGNKMRRSGATYEEMCEALGTDTATAEWAREKGEANGGREFRRIWEKADAAIVADSIDLTEDGVALAFKARHLDDLRYCHHTQAWYQWTGAKWRQEETKLAFSWARTVAREINRVANANGGKPSISLAKAAAAAGIERFAQADRTFAVISDQWDRDPWLAGTPGGTLDLRTGEIRPAARADYITKVLGVTPAPKGTPHPVWTAFLREATSADAELQGFLQRLCGYCLTGNVTEERLTFLYGEGGTGKGTFLRAIVAILGEYAVSVPIGVFTANTRLNLEYYRASFPGVRLVTASETEQGATWAEGEIKEMTGNEAPLSARSPYGKPFTFHPQFKLMLVGNHAPKLHGRSKAMERRLDIVPFKHVPQTADHGLKDKLQAEFPAILRWMVDGCLAWQSSHLGSASAIKAESELYFDAQDVFGRWLSEHCLLGPRLEIKTGELRANFTAWAKANGEEPMSTNDFAEAIDRTPDLKRYKNNGARMTRGVGLLAAKTYADREN